MLLTITGSGTSHGIPVIGCSCKTCTSSDPKDKRLRCSAFIEHEDGTVLVIDPGPEFRLQALSCGIKKLDAVLITHSHADHIHGLDDVRIFSFSRNIPVYGAPAALADIRNRFDYIFKSTQPGGGKPHLALSDCTPFGPRNPLKIGGVSLVPVPLLHGSLAATGWRIGSAAYLTDLSALPETSFALLGGLEHLVIDALRERPHSTHVNFTQALAIARHVNPQNTWFTHFCHDFTHAELVERLDSLRAETRFPYALAPAYDGLKLEIS